MNFPEKQIVSGPRSFVSEQQLEDKRRQRQEEWERTRKPEDPLEAPEEEYDHRTLYERLQENKMKKQAEVEEDQRLSNLVRGLESEEVSFLEQVEKTRMEEASHRLEEEEALLKEFAKSSHEAPQDEEDRKRKLRETMFSKESKEETESKKKMSSQAALLSKVGVKRRHQEETQEIKRTCPTLTVVGILPGIGDYGDSSDSERSDETDSDPEPDMAAHVSFVPQPQKTSSNSCQK